MRNVLPSLGREMEPVLIPQTSCHWSPGWDGSSPSEMLFSTGIARPGLLGTHSRALWVGPCQDCALPCPWPWGTRGPCWPWGTQGHHAQPQALTDLLSQMKPVTWCSFQRPTWPCSAPGEEPCHKPSLPELSSLPGWALDTGNWGTVSTVWFISNTRLEKH